MSRTPSASQGRRDSLTSTPTRTPSNARISRTWSDAPSLGRRVSRSRDLSESEHGQHDRLDPFLEDNDEEDGDVREIDVEVPHRDRGERLVRQRMRARQRQRNRQAAAATAAASLSPAAADAPSATGISQRLSAPPASDASGGTASGNNSVILGLGLDGPNADMGTLRPGMAHGGLFEDEDSEANVSAASMSTATPMYRASGRPRLQRGSSSARRLSATRRQSSTARTDRSATRRQGSSRPYDEQEHGDERSARLSHERRNSNVTADEENLGSEDDEDADEDDDDEEGQDEDDEDVEYTLKDRQDAINIEHPFGLPIWKPALYKKSRTVTRNAESALHSIPSAAAERLLLPGNMLWTILAGWWLCIVCLLLAFLINLLPFGGRQYARVIWGLGGYLLWPFGKYIEVEISPNRKERHATTMGVNTPAEERSSLVSHPRNQSDNSYETASTPVALRAQNTYVHIADESTSTDGTAPAQNHRNQLSESSTLTVKGNSGTYGAVNNVNTSMSEQERISQEQQVYSYVCDDTGRDVGKGDRIVGVIVYGIAYYLVIAPLMGIVCLICWGTVFPIPMAKLTWVVIKNLAKRPLALHFRSAPRLNTTSQGEQRPLLQQRRSIFRQLKPGDVAPRQQGASNDGKLLRHSRILVCTYRAMGTQYYKYTVGGVNILFINTLPFVFFTIFDFFFIEPYVHKHHLKTGFLPFISSESVVFAFALGSVIPLSYFIGMAVASISAQSSIGMGAVINATFGSIIEIILYAIALTQDKARLVEGSIVGSILAGVLLMPGVSMVSGAMRRKEQRFNARSAGVTSTMLIMAIIGILTPTLFYQIYGTFQLTCQGCPRNSKPSDTWACKRCFYEHVPPATDPFFQTNVKGLMYTCTIVLVLSYGVGLWFSLRTHASQIWQTPMPQERHPHFAEGAVLEAAATAVAAGAGGTSVAENAHGDAGGGHDAPSWTRTTSLVVLLSCTVLYATIAEILVDAVDAVLDGSGLDLKLLGVTLFALVPNATEFMNAMSFALNGNIALSMEIGSAYALQVCLIQIPAMVAFSAFYQANGSHDADINSTFTLIFPRWDVIAIIFSIFLLTYTYIESRSNYFRGTLLVLSYVVLISGFVFAPSTGDSEDPVEDEPGHAGIATLLQASSSTLHLVQDTTAYTAVSGWRWLGAIFNSLWAR